VPVPVHEQLLAGVHLGLVTVTAQPDDAPAVLTVNQAAAICQIGRNQMYAAVHRGHVYAVRIGRSWRVPRTELARFLTHDADPRVDTWLARRAQLDRGRPRQRAMA
jgi:excisionase family DNA binding protein